MCQAVFFIGIRTMVNKAFLNTSGYFAVAEQLTRRGFVMELIHDGSKRISHLGVCTRKGTKHVKVKSKQGREWPSFRGLAPDELLVLVDYQNRSMADRPVFYVMDAGDWRAYVRDRLRRYQNGKLGRKSYLEGPNNCPVFPDEKGFKGCAIQASRIEQHMERWSKIGVAK